MRVSVQNRLVSSPFLMLMFIPISIIMKGIYSSGRNKLFPGYLR